MVGNKMKSNSPEFEEIRFLGTIYPLVGYVGLFFIACVLYKNIAGKKSK